MNHKKDIANRYKNRDNKSRIFVNIKFIHVKIKLVTLYIAKYPI